MLHELVKYAESAGMAAEPGFKAKRLHWLVVMDQRGALSGVVPQGDPQAKKNQGRLVERCPDLTQPELVSAGAGSRHFLVDNAKVVALLTKEAEEKKLAKLAVQHAYFVARLREAAEAMPALALAANLIEDGAACAKVREQLATAGAEPTENVSFAVLADDGGTRVLVSESAWHPWWRRFRAGLAAGRAEAAGRRGGARADGPAAMLCLLSGAAVDPVKTHPKIENLGDVGGSSMGAALVSFDKPAMCSFGLEQSANAAMSEQAAATYRDTLNHLIREQSHRLAGAKVVYWYTGEGQRVEVPAADDPINLLVLPGAFEDDEEGNGAVDAPAQPPAPRRGRGAAAAPARARQAAGQALTNAKALLEAIRLGQRPDLHRARYCALTLSGNAGRVVVRDWMQGRFEDLVQHVTEWFEDLSIAARDGAETRRPPRFEEVLTCGLREKPPSQKLEDWLRPVASHRENLWKAALGGRRVPLPRALIAKTSDAHLATLLGHRFIPVERTTAAASKQPYPAARLRARMSLFRAYCNRFAIHHNLGDYHVKNALNVDHPRAAYHIGRLMAVLEMIQRRAQGEVGATIAQTHYATAATRPIVALPRLETLVQHHLPKINPPSLRAQYRLVLVEIKQRIHDTVPRTFDLEDQCIFHLGYYHQRAFQPVDESPHKHTTFRGEKVRSKSEVIIANLLALLGFEYEYEGVLYFKNDQLVTGKPDAECRSIHPDFCVKNSRYGKPVYIEHLGMMDNYAYRSDWKERLALYERLGIKPIEAGGGANGVLVATDEANGIIDCQALESQLRAIC